MKRIGIFVCYDKDGIVDASKEYLLRSLADILDRLIVAVNGELTDQSLRTIKKYTQEVLIRNNQGYDGGAYQDVLLNCVDRNVLFGYDELILVNDTFYGPFYPWKEVFEPMETLKPDFWGLTKQEKRYIRFVNEVLPTHVQSYFLVLKKM